MHPPGVSALMDGKLKASAAAAAASDVSMQNPGNGARALKTVKKLPFRPASDDTKPTLQDPILRSDPIETEESVLRLPPFPPIQSNP